MLLLVIIHFFPEIIDTVKITKRMGCWANQHCKKGWTAEAMASQQIYHILDFYTRKKQFLMYAQNSHSGMGSGILNKYTALVK